MSELTPSPGAWQAVHVFYAANPQPLLVNCVGPLISELREDGLLAGHFFINYWLEGPHVRLRPRRRRHRRLAGAGQDLRLAAALGGEGAAHRHG
ncbi:lantibiotic dehydratase C-terminal domain-containing protein, partial [Streptomyces sp. NPDC003832]